jgi:hypothetical protein
LATWATRRKARLKNKEIQTIDNIGYMGYKAFVKCGK